MREIGWVAYSYINHSFRFSLFAVLRLSNHFIEIPHNDFVRMFYETISTAGTENRSRRFLQFAHIKISYIFAIFFPSLADSGRAVLALSCRESIRRLSASASWESHPRALARTLSCKYHHSSRLSSPPPGAVPDGRILILWLADLSATEVLYRINWYEDGEPSCLSKNSRMPYR